jgi:hypothetical protein
MTTSTCDEISTTQLDDVGIQQRHRELTRGNAEVLRERLAEHLGINMQQIKPCVALIGNVEQGQRAHYAYVLAMELTKAGASEDALLGYLGSYARNCQQPPIAEMKFAAAEAVSEGRKALRKRERKQTIRGHGCGVSGQGPLLRFCPYGAPEGRNECPFIRDTRKAPKRVGIAGLVGTFNAVRQFPVRAEWAISGKGKKLPAAARSATIIRRRWLWVCLGALEAAKGHAGREYVGSLTELSFETDIPRRTLRSDLEAMAAAGWIEWEQGKRADAPGMPNRGCRVRRLLPGDVQVRAVLDAFPGAEVVR